MSPTGVAASVIHPLQPGEAPGAAQLVFHGGPGRRAEALGEEAWASFNVVSHPSIILGDTACRVNFAYESVVAAGPVRRIVDETLKTRALQVLVAKYYPARAGEALAAHIVAQTLVHVMEIQELSYRRDPEDA